MKKIFAVALIISMFVLLVIPAYAVNGTEYSDTIANNVPCSFGYDYSWEIVQKTPLYDLEGNTIAYCYDFKNTDGNLIEADTTGEVPETAYVIINCTDVGDPVLMFGVYGVSPYFDESFDRAFYLGTMEYYVQDDGVYYDLVTDAVTNYETLCTVDQSYQAALDSYELDTAEISSIRSSLIVGSNTSARSTTTDYNVVSGAANLQWQRGCAPTAIAMLIKTRYIIWDETKMIDSLANYMQTTDEGATGFLNIVIGTIEYINSQSNMELPDTVGWANPNSSGVPLCGFTYNTKEAFKASIDDGHPVGVYISSSTVTTSGYPNGIGAHMMSGIGYSFSSSGDYIICYTTNKSDGRVYFPCTSTGLHNNAWFYLIWE